VLARHHHRLAQVVVALQRAGVVRQGGQPADGVIQPGGKILVSDNFSAPPDSPISVIYLVLRAIMRRPWYLDVINPNEIFFV
jgi:hypothetical protein